MTRAKLFEDLFPPLVYRFLLRVYLRARGLGWHRFYGSYPTLDDVPSTPQGHDSDWYVGRATEQVEGLKPELSRRPMGDDAGLLVLPLLVSRLLAQSGEVTVLDFGGGAAQGLKSIFDHMPGVDRTRLRYVLVETSAMCRAVLGSLGKLGPFMEAVEQIPSSLPQPLIVHARGSIHYISDYHALLARLLALAPEIFIVAHTPVTDAPTFAQEQRNHPHRTLARWIFNRADLISEIEKSGYRLAFSFDHEAPVTYKKSSPLNDASLVFYRTPASN